MVCGGRFIPLAAFTALDGATLTDLLPGWRHNLAVLRSALAGPPGPDPPGSWPAGRTRLLPPVTPRQIFQVALNYADHAAEMALPLPQQPFVFAGLPSAVCGPYDDVVLPPAGQHDWELELAVVIRRRARHVDRAGAADCIAGYTIANDLTTRDRLRQAAPAAPTTSPRRTRPRSCPPGRSWCPATRWTPPGWA